MEKARTELLTQPGPTVLSQVGPSPWLSSRVAGTALFLLGALFCLSLQFLPWDAATRPPGAPTLGSLWSPREDLALSRPFVGPTVTGAVPGAPDPAVYAATVAKLALEVRKWAPERFRDRCLDLILGREGSLDASFAGQYQDWLLFHNFFWQVPYGQGAYLDLAANDPVLRSNTLFFDVCLGWRGICVEPNPRYHEAYESGGLRNCTLVKSCVANRASKMYMNFKADGSASAVDAPGSGRTEVQCETLESILGQQGVGPGALDLVSLDIEGSELAAVYCFPFHKYKVPVWLVEIARSPPTLVLHFLRNGYALAHTTLGCDKLVCPPVDGYGVPTKGTASPVGDIGDGIFVRLDHPVALGPAFLPGRPLHDAYPRGLCARNATGLGCPQQANVMSREEVFEEEGNRLRLGSCRRRVSRSEVGLAPDPPYDIATAYDPTQ